MIIASLLLGSVLVCVIWRPRGLNVAWPATIGALLAIMTGLVPLPTLRTIFGDTWDAAATLIALFLLSEALDSNGFFTWAALHLARIARGSGWKLYILILVLTTATTALLANDGAILILTPIFARLLVRIYSKESLWLPFIFAAGFFADVTSAIFIPSNLTNIILADANHLNFTEFAKWMALPTLLAALAAGLCFGLRFRKLLGEKYDPHVLEEPKSALHDYLVFWISWGALLILIIGYIIGGQLHLPISYIAGPVALTMMLLIQARKIRSAKKILLAAPWSILLYALGMFVVITAAFYANVLAFLIAPLQLFLTPAAGVIGTIKSGITLAILSAGANNLPATLIGVLVLGLVHAPKALSIYAITLGVDIGPKLTPYGSLATLLWLGILARRGIHISWRKYFFENWWVALIALAASFIGLVILNH
jgi:arsenical pump membrane protein